MSQDKSGFLQVKLCLCVDKATSQCYVFGKKNAKKLHKILSRIKIYSNNQTCYKQTEKQQRPRDIITAQTDCGK